MYVASWRGDGENAEPRVPPSTQASTSLRPYYITTALWPGLPAFPILARVVLLLFLDFHFVSVSFVSWTSLQADRDSLILPSIGLGKKITSKQKYITAFGLFVIDLKWLKKIHHIILNAFLRTKGRPIFLSMARGLFITKTWKKPWNQASVNFTFAKLKLSTKDSNAFVIKMPNFHSQMHIFSQMDLSKN